MKIGKEEKEIAKLGKERVILEENFKILQQRLLYVMKKLEEVEKVLQKYII
jgi:hypothetical protein